MGHINRKSSLFSIHHAKKPKNKKLSLQVNWKSLSLRYISQPADSPMCVGLTFWNKDPMFSGLQCKVKDLP